MTPFGVSFFMEYICLACDYRFKKSGDNAWQPCPECGGDSWWEESGYNTGTVFTPFFPSWGRYEREMKTGDPHEQVKAAEMFTKTREKEVKYSPRAARWERSRKVSLQKQKGAWVKQEKAMLRKKGL
jgi:predicted  nucleic acid-binding Zn-ribbon protein